MGLLFLFGFILWGWAEMSAFIYIGGEIGGLFTLLGVFVTAIIGLSLLKSQGMMVMARIRDDLAKGRAPVGSIADSIALVCGGVLMLVPGYVTDAIGILLFVPGLRTVAGAWILHNMMRSQRFKSYVHVGGRGAFTAAQQSPYPTGDDDDIIEGDVTEHSHSKNRLDKGRH